MYKLKYILIILTLLGAILLNVQSSDATEVNVGGSIWYAKWNPHWEDALRTLRNDDPIGAASNFDMEPTVMFGPVLSMSITDNISISTNLLYGYYRASVINMYYEGYSRIFESELNIHKIDLDTLIGYKFKRYFQIFLGIKYQYYLLEEEGQGLHDMSNISYSRNVTYHSIGPGIGLGVTIPVTNSFSVLWNAAFINLYSFLHDSFDIPSQVSPTHEYRLISYGVSTSLSFAYALSEYNITFVTGCKFQYLYYTQDSVKSTDYDGSGSIVFPRDYGGEYDMFLGISIMVVYSFSI